MTLTAEEAAFLEDARGYTARNGFSIIEGLVAIIDRHSAHEGARNAALKTFASVASDYRRRNSEIDHSTLVQVTLGSCLRAEAALTSHESGNPSR